MKIILILSIIVLIFCGKKKSNLGLSNASEPTSLWSQGKQIYEVSGCAQCHFFRGSGGRQGPALDEQAELMDGTMMRESILEPDRVIKPGYSAGVMPKDYGQKISEKEMDALIFFLTNP